MRTFSIILIATFVSVFSFAQEAGKVVETVKGKVIDSATSEPVSYTNIGLEGTFYGTASDGEGNFELKIPAELADKNIYFSAVGFVNEKFPVNTLFNKEFNIIRIKSKSYGIGDIDVAAQSKVLIRILSLAAEDIPYNFITGPYNLAAEYRNTKTIDDTISLAQKAEVLIYDQTGYSNPSKQDAFQNLKYSLKKESGEEDYRFASGTTNIDELLELDWVRASVSVLNPEILGGFQLKLDSEPEISGKTYWVISFNESKPTLAGSDDFYATAFNGKITIAKDDYSVLKIEGDVKSLKNNRQGKSLAIGKTTVNFYDNVSYHFSVDYRNRKPEKIFLEKQYRFKGKSVVENSALIFNKVQDSNLTVLESRDYFPGK
jgi:hypothetical protein